MKRTVPLPLLRVTAGALCACALLGASASPAFATDTVSVEASATAQNGWFTDPATGDRLYYIDGSPADAVFVTDGQTGNRYWFEGGRYVTEHAFFDPATAEWYWADADGTIAHGKDVFIPVDESDRSRGGKWVRIDDDYTMVKGEDERISPIDGQVHRWHFDPVTGEMSKGFTFLESDGGKWVYYDDITGWMLHGEQCKPNNEADLAAGTNFHWYYFDEETGAVQYGWKELPAQNKTVYYDEVMGWMLYGWQTIDGSFCHFDSTTGANVIKQPLEWVGTEKYSAGRSGRDWEKLVIHTTQIPTLEGVDEEFADTQGRQASAHFAVGGTDIHQYVDLDDTAWAVGDWTWNTRTVSIEHVGTSEEPPSYTTLDTSAKLMAALASSKGWTHLTLGQNVDVHASFVETPCPFGLDVVWLVERANHYLSLIR